MTWEQAIFAVGYLVLLLVVWRSPRPNREAIARVEKRVDGHEERLVALETATKLSTAEMREQVRVLLVPITKQQRIQGEQLNEISSVLHDLSNHLHVKESNASVAARNTA